MHRPADLHDTTGRRRALSFFVAAAVSAVSGSLATVLSAFALRPLRRADPSPWLRAGPIADLSPNTPVARVVSVRQADGWYRARTNRTIFLVWDGEQDVRALSATCSHLGCQVAWNADAKTFRCPCHGGVYAADGRVVSGPPPRPLSALPVDIRGGEVLVQLAAEKR
ncbi:MAG TPA: ubiquinol-cytochrome c reductase iron-sulfur subunit [Vicinamibacterales bacterium]|nr:ubiquinol-cytochrome c reductase iron-sulfur subunit [Vicinamibacterales bacterium]